MFFSERFSRSIALESSCMSRVCLLRAKTESFALRLFCFEELSLLPTLKFLLLESFQSAFSVRQLQALVC